MAPASFRTHRIVFSITPFHREEKETMRAELRVDISKHMRKVTQIDKGVGRDCNVEQALDAHGLYVPLYKFGVDPPQFCLGEHFWTQIDAANSLRHGMDCFATEAGTATEIENFEVSLLGQDGLGHVQQNQRGCVVERREHASIVIGSELIEEMAHVTRVGTPLQAHPLGTASKSSGNRSAKRAQDF